MSGKLYHVKLEIPTYSIYSIYAEDEEEAVYGVMEENAGSLVDQYPGDPADGDVVGVELVSDRGA